MKHFPDRVVLLIVDQLMLSGAFVFTYWLSYLSGISPGKSTFPLLSLWDAYLVINLFWLLLFALFGLYGKWKNTSRFDEIISVYKTITVGAVAFLVITFVGQRFISPGKLIALGYWASLVVLVGMGRIAVRTVQRILLTRGIGLRPSIIVGDSAIIADMLKRIKQSPALGYDVKGVIPIRSDKAEKKIGG